jgi:hypothetical protein
MHVYSPPIQRADLLKPSSTVIRRKLDFAQRFAAEEELD